MNYIFISPNFPETYVHFAVELKNAGVNVLGIGDQPYASLSDDLQRRHQPTSHRSHRN